MRRKRFLFAIIFVFFLQDAISAKKIRLFIGSIQPDGTIYDRYVRKFRRELQKKSNGRVKVTLFSGGRLGNEKELIRKLKKNRINMAWFTGVGMGVIYPHGKIMDIPFYFKSNKQLDYVTKKIFPVFKKEISKLGFELVAWGELGETYLYSNRPIIKLNDMKGLKMWAPKGDKMVKTIFQSFGIVPKYLEIQEVLSAQMKGQLDAIFAPPAAVAGLQWHRNVKYMTTPAITHISLATVLNKKYFDKLPKDIQQMISSIAMKVTRSLTKKVRPANRQAIVALRRRGIKIVKASKRTLQNFKRVSKSAVKKLVQKKVLSKKIVKLVKKYKSQSK